MSANCCSVPVEPCSESGVAGTMIMKRMMVSFCRCGVGAVSAGSWPPPHPYVERAAGTSTRRVELVVHPVSTAGQSSGSPLELEPGGRSRLDAVAERDAVAGGLGDGLEDRHEAVV